MQEATRQYRSERNGVLGSSLRIGAVLISWWFLALSASAAPFAYVTTQGDGINPSYVFVIDTAAANFGSVVAMIPVGVAPYGVAATPNGAFLYVLNVDPIVPLALGSVSIIRTVDNSVIANIPVGLNPTQVKFTSDGKFAWVVNFGGYGSGSISVINTSSMAVIQNTTDQSVNTIYVGGAPASVVFSPDGSTAYVSNFRDGTISVIQVTGGGSGGNVTNTINVTGFNGAQLLAVKPDGSQLYLADYSSNVVHVIDLTPGSNYQLLPSITVGSNPVGLGISPDGKFLWVTDYGGTDVSVIDISTNTVVAGSPLNPGQITVGGSAGGVAFTPDGTSALVTSQSGPTLYVINTSTYVVTAIALPAAAVQTNYVAVAPVPLTISANNTSWAYGSANPSFTVSANGLINGDTLASIGVNVVCSTTATVGSPVGNYPITCSGPSAATYYTIIYQAGVLMITPVPLTITANNTTKSFNAPNPAFSATYSGFVNGDTAASLSGTLSCTAAATTTSPAGSYPITCSGQSSNNYTITYVPGTLTILNANARLAPATQSFGTVTRGAGLNINQFRVFTLTNTGVVTLTGITSPTIPPNPDFTIVALATTCGTVNPSLFARTTSLHPGASCVITVRFHPPLTDTAGPKAGTLSVGDAAGTQTSALTGTAR